MKILRRTCLMCRFCSVCTLAVYIYFSCVGSFSQTADAFNPAPNSYVVTSAVLSDGRIVVGGDFTSLAGQTRGRFGRLHADGTLDASFANLSSSDDVNTIVMQPDGRTLVGGLFTTFGGFARNRIARLNANGTLDTSFNPNAGGTVNCLRVLESGKILIGGTFTTLGGQSRANLGRLNDDGTLDTNFAATANGSVLSLAVQTNGQILVAGSFTTLTGQPRNRIGRLNADGTLDASFNPGANSTVNALDIQSDGMILVAGGFSNLGGQTINRVGRLDVAGVLDASFNPGAAPSGGQVFSMCLQSDGKIILGGAFNSFFGQARINICRLHTNGSLDTNFTSGTSSGINDYVRSVGIQTDGKILVGGTFTTLAGVSRANLGRLSNPDPATNSLSLSGDTITWLRGGSSPEISQTTFEASTNGANWFSLDPGKRITGGWQLVGLSLPADADIRARGITGGGRNNGSTWFIEARMKPVIYTQPASRTNNSYTLASFSVAAGGNGPLSYQWFMNGLSLSDGGKVSGALTPNLSVANVLGADAGDFFVVASNSSSSVTSSVARLSVLDPSITLQPVSRTNNATTAASFSVSALGSLPFGYQWLKGGVPILNGANVQGAQTSSLTLSNLLGADAEGYSVIVSNSFGSVTSFVAMLKVVDPFILNQPTDQLTAPGQTATFNTTVLGSVPLVYQWRKNGAALVGETNSAINLTNVQCSGGGGFDVVITNSFGKATSAVVYLTIDANLAATDSWNPGAGNEVYSQAMLPDGRVLVGGGPFSTLGGQSRNFIGLIDHDGALATNFNPNVNDYVYSQLVQTDGRIVIGGHFSSVGGQTRQRLARLNADGSLDPGFNPGASDSTYTPRVKCISQQSDGKIIVGGVFSTLGGEPHLNIGRLNTNGTVDSTFTQWADWVSSIVVQPDGKILVGGTGSLKRLNPNGTLDGGFQAIFGNGTINALALQSDGKILVGGVFANLAGQPRQNIGRLNPDGSLDPSFNPGANDLVASIFVQCDGNILLTGYFTNLCNQIRHYVGRLNADGSLDCGFNPGVGGGSYPVIYSLMNQPDGKVLLGGYFNSVGGQVRSSIGRLDNTGPATEHLSFDGSRLTWLRGGTSPEVCWTTFEVTSNGTDWNFLGTGTRTSDGWEMDNISLVANVTIRARGFVQASGNYSGGGGSSGWFAERTLAIDPNLPPKIVTNDGNFGFRTNQFGFNVAGLIAQAVVVEASTNLFQWVPIHTNLIGNLGVFLFRDLQSSVYARRFYRARLHTGSLPPPSFRSGTAGIQNGQFKFNLDGVAGQTVVIESSTNLVNWSSLVTNTLGIEPFLFSDPASSNSPVRFYRARVQ